MNTNHPIFCALLCLFVAGLPSYPLHAQGGSLTPPGAPAVTMKSLAEIDPGTPLNPADAPFVLTQPGSYYLTGNIIAVSGTGAAAILIASDNVTLDLRGFAIIYSSGANTYAVALTDPFLTLPPFSIQNVVVRNGHIRGAWSDGGVAGPGAGNTAHDSRFENLTISGGAYSGISAGERCHIRNCRVNGAVLLGIRGGNRSLIEDCTASNTATTGASSGISAGDDSVIRNCIAYDNGNFGILTGSRCVITGCVAAANTGWGIFSTGSGLENVSNCVAYDNDGAGIDVNGTVENCVARLNGLDGIANHGGTATNSIALENGAYGFNGMGSVSGCYSSGNTRSGYRMSSWGSAVNCFASGNSEHGFECFDSVSFQNCSSTGNTLDGFHGFNGCSISDSSAYQNDGNGVSLIDNGAVHNVASSFNGSGAIGIGIEVRNHSVLFDNLCHSNTVAGIVADDGNRIDSNTTHSNGRGIRVDGTENLVVRNFARNNTIDFSVVAGNYNAAIIAAPGAGFFTSNAWANFSD